MLGERARRTEEVCEWGRKLFYNTGKRVLPNSGPAWTDDPSAFIAHLEETSEGARWLRQRWVEMRCLIISDEGWTFTDQFRFVRLLGKHAINATDDPELNELFLAWETIEVEWGTRFWDVMRRITPYPDPAFSWTRAWREIVPRPESPEAAVAFLRSLTDREIQRLDELIADLDLIESNDAVELAEQASFLDNSAGERLHRYITARTRELHRTIDLLAKLRKSEADARLKALKLEEAEEKRASEPNRPAPRTPKPRPNSYRSDMIESIFAEAMTDNLAQLLEGCKPPQTSANEPKNPSPPAG
jgi:hypothetical protein